jgi:metal-sulfur cluster biosynthetic enzyme
LERSVNALLPTLESLRQVINTVEDPCSRAAGATAGLVDMGLVRDLSVVTHESAVSVHVVIGVTEYACLMGPSFVNEVRKRLFDVPGVSDVEVDLDDKFDWDPDDMSESYKAHLAARRAKGNAHLLPLRAVRPHSAVTESPTTAVPRR